MQKRLKVLMTLLFVSLVISNIFFAYMFVADTRALGTTIEKQQINSNVLSFTQLFMEKILRGSKVVSFDDRLQLENSVRALKDQNIFDAWQNFTNAKSQTDVQQEFYTLFDLLLKKISI